jgi:hypothetical protein
MLWISFLPLFKGISLGIVCGHLYSAYRLAVIGYSAIIIMPGAVIMIAGMLFACRESLYMSFDTLRLVRGRTSLMAIENKSALKLYAARYGVLMISVAASAAVDAIVYRGFGGWFSF